MKKIKKLTKKQKRGLLNFKKALKSGEITARVDGFGSFQGYDDEAGHVYETAQDVIDAWGLED